MKLPDCTNGSVRYRAAARNERNGTLENDKLIFRIFSKNFALSRAYGYNKFDSIYYLWNNRILVLRAGDWWQ